MRPVPATRPPRFWPGAPRNLRIPEIAPLTTLWDAPGCSFELLGVDDLAVDILTHQGSSPSLRLYNELSLHSAMPKAAGMTALE